MRTSGSERIQTGLVWQTKLEVVLCEPSEAAADIPSYAVTDRCRLQEPGVAFVRSTVVHDIVVS